MVGLEFNASPTTKVPEAVVLAAASQRSSHDDSILQDDVRRGSNNTIDLEKTLLERQNGPSASVADGRSTAQKVGTMAVLSSLNFLGTLGSGILIAALPQIAQDIGLSDGLILWPAAVYSLAAGCLLLIFGAVADVVGAKLMWVTGSYLYIIFTLGIGFARTGVQMIVLRTFQGAAISMSLPTTVSLVTNSFPRGSWRNTAFAMTGVGYPLGFAVGLVLGGVLTDTAGWRWAYYMMAIINFCISTVALWALPSIKCKGVSGLKWYDRLATEIDWLGAAILSAASGVLMYVLAVINASYKRVGEPHVLILLVISVCLLGLFPFWMHHQTKTGRPALIPNRLWKNTTFTSICISVFLSWASLNAIQYFTTLYFQQIQKLSALDSSLRFLPHIFMGVVTNLLAGWLVSRVHIQKLSVISALMTAIAPALMATAPINSKYWLAPLWSLLLSPINPDVMFTVSNLVISDAFPPEDQSLAGGVFNEIAQFGNSVGLTIAAAIGTSVSEQSGIDDYEARQMEGFRASFWTVFTATILIITVAAFGLRQGGLVGRKQK